MFRYNGKRIHTWNNDTKQSWKYKIKVQGGYSVPLRWKRYKGEGEITKRYWRWKILLGEPIVPKEYKKMVIKNNQVTEERFTIHGRKIALNIVTH